MERTEADDGESLRDEDGHDEIIPGRPGGLLPVEVELFAPVGNLPRLPAAGGRF